MSDPQRVLLGEVTGVHGLQGGVKLRSHTDPSTAILRYQPWALLLRGAERCVRGAKGKLIGKALVVQLPDIDTREAAEAIVGAEIWVDRAALPAPVPGEYYWIDLEGLEVITVSGQVLGRVASMMATGANDVMVVHGERERLVPFVQPDYVRSVDLASGRIVVDWDPDF